MKTQLRLSTVLTLLSTFISFGYSIAHAGIEIPSHLSESDRLSIIRVLGFSSSTKILSNPYALGGYDGLELGLLAESLPLDDIDMLGEKNKAPQEDMLTTQISIGKGLYNNVDVFIRFMPYTQKYQFSQYGALLRWSFLNLKTAPLTASILFHNSNSNFANLVDIKTYGIDMIAGYWVEPVSLYAGMGWLNGIGKFIGGEKGVTDSMNSEESKISGFHSFFGLSINYQSLFIALQIDRYPGVVYSGKLGFKI